MAQAVQTSMCVPSSPVSVNTPDRLYTMHNQLISQLVYFLLSPGNGETREACMVVCKRRWRGRRITGQRCLCARRPAKGVLHTYINLVYLLVYVPLCTTRAVLPTATHHSPPSIAGPRAGLDWAGGGGGCRHGKKRAHMFVQPGYICGVWWWW